MTYEQCFVYQCLTHICHGADISSHKFINSCLDCPCFRAWIESIAKLNKDTLKVGGDNINGIH